MGLADFSNTDTWSPTTDERDIADISVLAERLQAAAESEDLTEIGVILRALQAPAYDRFAHFGLPEAA